MVKQILLLVALVSTAAAQPVERWECDSVRWRLIALARPYLTPEQRVLYRMKVDQRGANMPSILCMTTREEIKCLQAARSYGEGRRCLARPPVDIPVPPERENDPVALPVEPPFPPREELSALASAATYELVVNDSSHSAGQTARAGKRLAAILAPVKLRPARKGETADLTITLDVQGTGVGLPYENLASKKVSTQYTAGVLEGKLTVSAGGQPLAERAFDIEDAPLSGMDYQTRRFDRPEDAPFAEMLEAQSGAYARLLDLILVTRGPDAHFALIAARKEPGMLSYYARNRIEYPPKVLGDALRAAQRDKRAAVRDAVAKGMQRINAGTAP